MARFCLLALTLSIFALAPGCNCAGNGRPIRHDGSIDTGSSDQPDTAVDAPGSGDDAFTIGVSDSGIPRSCASDSVDTEGCSCTAGDAPRACWPYTADPNARGMGICRDGMQTCVNSTEFAQWTPCTGATLPGTEDCTNGVDDTCDGNIDCADPTCASDPACASGCTEGDTRDCYTFNPRTLGVGACHAGTQTCTGGVWTTDCVGEQGPQMEDCSSPNDLNCNHARGCFDLFACASSPACMEHCADPLMPGCVCPMGGGDVATCPRGTHAVTMGTIGGTIQCCPCQASDCGSPNCCGETICHGNAACGGLNCPPLPSSCMGMVNADCDDFPEDCDEPCCECYGDCSGP